MQNGENNDNFEVYTLSGSRVKAGKEDENETVSYRLLGNKGAKKWTKCNKNSKMIKHTAI